MDQSQESKVRAETAAGIKSVVQGRNGKEWSNACLANPHITLPPGAGYLIVRYHQDILIETAETMTRLTGFLQP